MSDIRKRILVTGAAGFIGFHLAGSLLKHGHEVIGLDNLNNYYDISLKKARLAILEKESKFTFEKVDLADQPEIKRVFSDYRPQWVVNLAAQAGVRYSLENPYVYAESNLTGFLNILEGCRNAQVEHLVYASSSSVYGANTKIPFSVHDNVDHPVSLYAATKKANELMAHTYSHLYRLPTTGLRFFTVYGPWGRPDMAYFKFTKSILAGQPIDVFNFGKNRRDFTYIEDIVTGIIKVLSRIPAGDPNWSGDNPDCASSSAPYRVYNIGNNKPVELLYFIQVLEDCLEKKAILNLLPAQPGDVIETYADIDDLVAETGFRPQTSIEQGMKRFVDWYKGYFGCL
jgi:UDP-glucuronate 4-epimerase